MIEKAGVDKKQAFIKKLALTKKQALTKNGINKKATPIVYLEGTSKYHNLGATHAAMIIPDLSDPQTDHQTNQRITQKTKKNPPTPWRQGPSSVLKINCHRPCLTSVRNLLLSHDRTGTALSSVSVSITVAPIGTCICALLNLVC